MNTLGFISGGRRKRKPISALIVLIGVFLLLAGGANARQFLTIGRVNVGPNFAQTSNGQRPAISEDGTYVAFWSDSGNLVPGDTNNTGDVFVHNRSNNETARVSIGNGNVQSNATTFNELDISNNGVLIAMASDATNFVTGDTNNLTDVYVFDRSVGAMARISNAVQSQQTNGRSFNPVISGNGLYVLFRSDATNLVFNDTNGKSDIFLFDRTPNVQFPIAIVNVPTGPADASAQSNNEDPNSRFDLTDDGTVIVFDSVGSNLIANDTNNTYDIFIRDRPSNTTTLASRSTEGVQGNGASTQPVISADGRYVVFRSEAWNLVAGDSNGVADIFVFDRVAKTTKRVSVSSSGEQANGQSATPSVSKNGRYISFWSTATNLVPGDTNNVSDIFVHDTVTGITTRASVNINGEQGNGASAPLPKISGDGNYIAFESLASNLIGSDTNNSSDVFVGIAGPAAPTNLVATPLSETSIKLDWVDNADNEQSYLIERKRADKDWRELTSLAKNSVTFTDTGLNECETYRYRVYAVGTVGRTVSNTVKTQTLGCPPGEFALVNPNNGAAIVNPANVSLLQWEASTEADTFDITLTRTSDEPDTTLINVTDEPAGNLCDTDYCYYPVNSAELLNGSYQWNVIAENDKGATPATQPFTFIVDDTLPPRDFVLHSPADGTYILTPGDLTSLTWKENKDATSYGVALFKISENPATRLGEIINLIDLSPESDGDALTCNSDAKVCEYVLSASEQDQLTTGQFAWTATAYSPGGTPNEARNGPAIFSINTDPLELVENRGFEGGKFEGAPVSWIVKNPTKDKLKCNKDKDGDGIADKIFAYSGECAFRIKGNVNERVKLQQNIEADFITSSEALDFSAYVRTQSSTNFRAKVVVKYQNTAVPNTKGTILIPAGSIAYTRFEIPDIAISDAVATVKVQFKYRGTVGKVYVDDVSLVVDSTSLPLVDVPQAITAPNTDTIPLPEAPDGFRR